MSAYTYAILSVLLVSIISLVGIFTLAIDTKKIQKYTFVLVSLAVGALLGDAFIHLIPQSLSNQTNSLNASLFIIAGILLFFILEKFLHWHHHQSDCLNPHPIGKMILISDGLHNLIDGLIITASYLIDIKIGISSTLAIILHEIPQEIGDFGVLLHAGFSKGRALWWNFVSALSALFGILIVFIFGNLNQSLNTWVIPLTAGGFIYIALSDLIPELHKTKTP
jgi:zinc and cadmium transporter